MTQAVIYTTLATDSGHQIGVASLNSERSLNALSLAMVDSLTEQLDRWAEDDRIVCIWLQGSGDKAFCAGGDIRAIYEAAKAAPGELTEAVTDFFSREYRLDHKIHRFPKPMVVWGSGIVMGGGLGLMAGASHRIATETSRIAMPEISIGLFPDVGGTWFLNRMPGQCGRFLALTGYSMNGADARYVGLADHLVLSERRSALLDALTSLGWQGEAGDRDMLSGYLRGLEEQDLPQLPESLLHREQASIDAVMQGDSLAQVAGQLNEAASQADWLARPAKTLQAGSPITAHLIWHQLSACGDWSIEQVFQQELVWAVRCAQQGDFVEGVRALLIDKDRNPQWRFTQREEVTPDWLARFHQSPFATNPLADLTEDYQ
ncbi:enoyl-CoA hydratase/isomerase family protein [Ferrimonas marina]|uniref:3-hydroxyisobutyryl-CoA hydrolase n=1 Tax=Ferrimonas marina TaxID=299255 RepID=A0A1M5VNU3_9GAMM|nr:enoyl-CoA hydratase/isomerase family protein [Ferrimonas marina]SHH76922.1 Enoyl-CoA hydratase/carnithine racemase [Ferrimonas marina]